MTDDICLTAVKLLDEAIFLMVYFLGENMFLLDKKRKGLKEVSRKSRSHYDHFQ